MNPKNIIRLLQEAFDQPQYDFESAINDDERTFSFQLETLIKDSINDAFFVETHETLIFEDQNDIQGPILIKDDDISDFENETSSDLQLDSSKVDEVDDEYKRKVIEYWKSGKKRKLKFKNVQSKFKRLKSKRQLYRWEAQLEKGGTINEKLNKVSEYVISQFQEAVEKSIMIHDVDIRRWALKARDDFSLSPDSFTASSKWLHTFKKKYKIVSRKINKFITQKSVLDQVKLKEQATEFVGDISRLISEVGECNVFNTDQSGFNLEMHTGRTLSFKGELKIEALAQSLNSMTHSYTIQPLISANGTLLSPLLIVLQEKDGIFGPRIRKNLFTAENVYVLASKSGKLTSNLVQKWFTDIFLPSTNNESILLLDSWSGQNSQMLNNLSTSGKSVLIKTIPAGTTGMIQPLDVFFFRPWKNFIRYFSDNVILHNNKYDINLHHRNNVIKLQSLIHNQFASPRFQNLIKYSWYKSGYIKEKPLEFDNPVDFCFKNCESSCEICNVCAVIRCAWCKKSLCIIHFFNEYHICKTFKK